MIVWRGRGLLSLLAGFLGMGIGAGLVRSDSTAAQAGLVWLLAGIAAAGLNYLFVHLWVKESTRVFVDEKTGQRVVFRNSSSLFWIRTKYWTWVFLGLGIVMGVPLLASGL